MMGLKIHGKVNINVINYRPQTKLREDNVITAVCLFTWGSDYPQCHAEGRPPPPQKADPPPSIQSPGGRYTSYWNAYLLMLIVQINAEIMTKLTQIVTLIIL